mmetsp:Transcript_12184/g.18822  ORF Transcript_12184/g.18822 Transcript_12184/m.18822 type:complete len:219 (+) Transcript_12184:915-1571(+)
MILGFGNGAIMSLNTKNDTPLSDCIEHTDLYFSAKSFAAAGNFLARNTSALGPDRDKEDKPLDKLRMVYLEAIFDTNPETGQPTTIVKNENLLLSLSAGQLSCHTFPEFERLEVLEADQIIDFEPYTKVIYLPPPITAGRARKPRPQTLYFLAVLFSSGILKIFQYERPRQSYKYITKVQLSFAEAIEPMMMDSTFLADSYQQFQQSTFISPGGSSKD